VGQIFISAGGEILIYEGRGSIAVGSGYRFRNLTQPTRYPYFIFDETIKENLYNGRPHPFDSLKALKLKNTQIDLPPSLLALPIPNGETVPSSDEKEPVETIKKDKEVSSPLKSDDTIVREFGDGQPMQFSKDRISGPNESASSRTPGGIDFRNLPIVTQAVTNLSINISSSAIHNLVSVNLDGEWQEIERMASSGITPSSERIKEYIQTSCAQDNITQDRDKVLLCISDILRLQEERCEPTSTTLRDILVVLESMKNAQELREVFLGKTI
jgi:hypothetical protein